MVEAILPHEVAENLHVPHIESSTKLVGVGLSAVALAIGGYLGYNFYWARRWDPWAWVQATRMRAITHSFLWNRWYMNPVYYRVFVDGTLALKQVIYDNFEAKVLIPLSDVVAKASQTVSDTLYAAVEERVIFGTINTGVPSVFVRVYNRVKTTQTGLLSVNLIYVAALLLLLIVGMIIMGGL
jgi:NADH:ubiquinone oxidoreductase subunit 5 (subunit L)/multisubunit Na+/H+ antiporter MnhA subunit